MEKIIQNEGCVIYDENFRTGRRARRVDTKGDCRRNSQVARRVNNVGGDIPLHASLEDAKAILEVRAWQECQKWAIGDDGSVADSDESDHESMDGVEA